MTSTLQKTSNISIIVPTLNEADNLPILQPAAAVVKELIVVDGGSTDDTVKIAQDLGFRVIEKVAPGGRGAQLNTGAENASAPLILFLHADTLLPSGFQDAVTKCLADPNTVLGAFSLKVDSGDTAISFIAMCANIRSRFLQIPYGDQSFFLQKDTFVKLGGFPELPIMEDFIFVRQARKRGKIVTLPQTVTTSARRWQRLGPFRTTLINQLVVLGYYLGIKPDKLAAFYRNKKSPNS